MNHADKEVIWGKTNGRCHFCGKRLSFGAKSGEPGRWHVDHVLPKARGGRNDISNYLPICRACNRMRWYLDSKRIKKTFRYGVIAYGEVKRKSELGKQLRTLYLLNKTQNKNRRVG